MLSSQNTMLRVPILIGLSATFGMSGLCHLHHHLPLVLGKHTSLTLCGFLVQVLVQVPLCPPLRYWLCPQAPYFLVVSFAFTTLVIISILMIPKTVTLAHISQKNSRSIKPAFYWTPPSGGPIGIQTQHVRSRTYPRGQPISKS